MKRYIGRISSLTLFLGGGILGYFYGRTLGWFKGFTFPLLIIITMFMRMMILWNKNRKEDRARLMSGLEAPNNNLYMTMQFVFTVLLIIGFWIGTVANVFTERVLK
jgi:hypothetical protein